ncbi:hypothetical protein [Hwangdonia sp.]|uniref:hypothetical protein n=1 Tax=Hwangdonia sp. TaxID=1883432 RepID=UPI003AB864EC
MVLRKIDNNINENDYLNNIENANTNFINNFIENDFILPHETPVEIHPYLEDVDIQSFKKYIIGTFPPMQYLRDTIEIPNNIGDVKVRPKIPYFHGQRCDMWQFFLTPAELNEVGVFDSNNDDNTRLNQKNFIIQLLNFSSINYSDIIRSTKRSEYDANDSSLYNIVPNLNLVVNILTNEKAEYLNFNTSTLFNNGNDFGFYHNNYGINNIGDIQYKVQSYELFLKVLSNLGFTLEAKLNPNDNWIQIQIENEQYFIDNYKHKVFTKLRVSTKSLIVFENEEFKDFSREFKIITGPSPSASANVSLGNNPIYNNWLAEQDNINNVEPLTHIFRKEFYGLFRNNPDQLVNWNVY